MKRSRFRPTPGRRAAASLLAFAGTLLLGACNYGLNSSSGFPASIRTVCIEPFENQTDRGELTNQVFTALNDKVRPALGLRPGDCKGGADAIIRGKILRYDNPATNYTAGSQPGQTQTQLYQFTLTVGVEIIDRKRNVMLWESNGVNGQGTYEPNQSDTVGQKKAVDKLVQAIIDGAQSQW